MVLRLLYCCARPRRKTTTVTSSVDPSATAVLASVDAMVSHGTRLSTDVNSSLKPRASRPPPPPAHHGSTSVFDLMLQLHA